MNDLKIPNHLGIIMDGNRRWAREKNKKTIEGHLAGANRILSLAKYIFKRGVNYLSIYAFSTENFNRSEEEVSYLMNLIVKFFNERAGELNENNIKIIVSGKRDHFSSKVLKCIDDVCKMTENNTGGVLNVCLNYGGRDEILGAVKNIAKKIQNNEVKIEDITEQMISDNLYTANQPEY